MVEHRAYPTSSALMAHLQMVGPGQLRNAAGSGIGTEHDTTSERRRETPAATQDPGDLRKRQTFVEHSL